MFQTPSNWIYFLYSDGAYGQCYGVIAPHLDSRGWQWLRDEELLANYHLLSARIMVEHRFSKVSVNSTYTSFKGGLKLGAQPVSLYFLISVFISNLLTCLRGENDPIAAKFSRPPPTLREYLGLEQEVVIVL
jgi:hypothetical protein